MKKFLLFLMGILLVSGSLYAKSLSVGATFGLIADQSAMGATILKDGAIDLKDTSLAYATGIKTLIWADNKAGALLNAAKGTNSVPLRVLSKQEEGAPMMGLNMELVVMYDLNDSLKLPLFARLAFDYAMSVNGVTQKITLDDGVNQAAIAKGFPSTSTGYTGGYGGGTCELAWFSRWMEVPLTIGISVPIADKGKVYGGMGMTFITGGWGIDATLSKQYVAYLTSYAGKTQPLITKKVSDTFEFAMTGFTVNFLLGAEANLTESVALTVEYWMSGASPNTFTKTHPKKLTQQLLTAALTGDVAYGMDNQYMNDLAYPARIGASFIKIGAKYYIM